MQARPPSSFSRRLRCWNSWLESVTCVRALNQRGLDVLLNGVAVRGRQAADGLQDQAVVKREQFQPDQAVLMQPGGLQLGDRSVTRPGLMGARGYHGQDRMPVVVESRLADHQGWAFLVAGSFYKGKRNDNYVPLFTSHGKLRRLPERSTRLAFWKAPSETQHRRVQPGGG